MERHLSGLTHSRHTLINSARKIIGLDWVDLIEDLNNLAEQCLDSSYSCRVQLLCVLHVNCMLSGGKNNTQTRPQDANALLISA